MSLLGRILIFLTKKTVVSEDILPEAQESPSKDSNVSEDILAEGGVAPEALSMAESVDVLANDPVVVSLDSESLEEPRESYCSATWAAPAAPADSPMNQDLSNTPQPFKKMRRLRFPPRNVPRENICYKCSREIFVLRPLRGGKRISCDACNAPFHEKCFYSSVVRPEDGVGPCCLEAQ